MCIRHWSSHECSTDHQASTKNVQPANPPFVTLSCQKGAPAEAGWTIIEGCGNSYTYRYDGGSDDHGNVEVHGRGQVVITVKLASDPALQISGVSFDNDPDQQLSNPNNSPRVATIKNRNNALMENAYYALEVTDTSNDCALTFDQMISNRRSEE